MTSKGRVEVSAWRRVQLVWGKVRTAARLTHYWHASAEGATSVSFVGLEEGDLGLASGTGDRKRSGNATMEHCGKTRRTALPLRLLRPVPKTSRRVKGGLTDPGVSKIRLVDFDNVILSSLKRHATAKLTDVGKPKVKCIECTLKQIARWVEIDARIELWHKGDGATLFERADWVHIPHSTLPDAIDSVQTKVDFLKYCHENLRLQTFRFHLGIGPN
ncbi:hypothetical protein DFH09DRAFT_1081962 [Mycena vulgaris]|nr:hypothetical protein DFH09DRAFT_1081962 [Mycena vulgaris]